MLGRGTKSIVSGLSLLGDWRDTRANFPSFSGKASSRSVSGAPFGMTLLTKVKDCGRWGRVPLLKAPKTCERCAESAWAAICAGLRPLDKRFVTVIAAAVPEARPPP